MTSPAAGTVGGGSSAPRVAEGVKKNFPAAEIIDGVKSKGPAFLPRHDSLREGITDECEGGPLPVSINR
jgi:hypothetical protein